MEFKFVFQKAAVPMFIADHAGNVVAANDACGAYVSHMGPELLRENSSADEFECRIANENEGRFFKISSSHLEDGGRELKLYALQDITLQKEAEQRLLEHQLSLIANTKMSVLGQMTSGIAHEINNPLAVISLRASQLKEWASNRDMTPDKVADFCSKIEDTAMRIHKIVRSLRSFARESNDDPPEVIPVRLIVEDTLELCRERIKLHGIALEIPAIDANYSIRCKPVQISQVLLNLLCNSCDAISALPEKWIRIDVALKEGLLEFAVTDSGRGIPPFVRQKLFSPFFTTKAAGKGTGIGLSLSRQIISNHNGRIWLDPQCENTRFIFSLPRA